MTTSVATANILYKLAPSAAEKSLTLVLAQAPDLVGLQEWFVWRTRLLRRTGDVQLVPSLGLHPLSATNAHDYHWVATTGAGCVAGARTDRFDLVEGRAVALSGIGRAERADHPFNVEPPRIAAVGIFRDRQVDRTVALVSYHFVSGAESHGEYRADRPRLTDRHRQEVRRLETAIAELQDAGHVVYAVGDANFHLLGMTGLTSAWAGRSERPGTIGKRGRTIGDVHGPGPAQDVRLTRTPSDHRAVVVERAD